MLERVLVPLDGSPLSSRVLPLVRHLLDRRSTIAPTEPTIEILRIVTDAEVRAGEERALDAVAEARHALEGDLELLGRHAGDARIEVLVGDPTTGILAEAARMDATLVAMTTHGRTGAERLLRGSVAERVLRRVGAPLLLVNPWSLAKGDLPLRRVFVPLDGSEESRRAVSAVDALAGAFGPDVVLFHAIAPGSPVSSNLAAADDLAATAKKIRGGTVATRVVRAEPAEAILEAVAESGADLVALTTHGRSGIPRWAFGSVAEAVIRECPRPLLVIPPRARIERREVERAERPAVSER